MVQVIKEEQVPEDQWDALERAFRHACNIAPMGLFPVGSRVTSMIRVFGGSLPRRYAATLEMPMLARGTVHSGRVLDSQDER